MIDRFITKPALIGLGVATISLFLYSTLMTKLYLGKRDDLVTEIQACNTRIEAGARQGEKLAREALAKAHQQELAEKDDIIRNEREALQLADMRADDARAAAAASQFTIDRLIREALNNGENIAPSEACLLVDFPAHIADGMR